MAKIQPVAGDGIVTLVTELLAIIILPLFLYLGKKVKRRRAATTAATAN
jgi:hypothetical protein